VSGSVVPPWRRGSSARRPLAPEPKAPEAEAVEPRPAPEIVPYVHVSTGADALDWSSHGGMVDVGWEERNELAADVNPFGVMRKYKACKTEEDLKRQLMSELAYFGWTVHEEVYCRPAIVMGKTESRTRRIDIHATATDKVARSVRGVPVGVVVGIEVKLGADNRSIREAASQVEGYVSARGWALPTGEMLRVPDFFAIATGPWLSCRNAVRRHDYMNTSLWPMFTSCLQRSHSGNLLMDWRVPSFRAHTFEDGDEGHICSTADATRKLTSYKRRDWR
jgi:hypothetical protein